MAQTFKQAGRRMLTWGCAVWLAGCSLMPRIVEREPKTAAEVGSDGVAVVSAAPFELFVKDLQPNFEIDGKKALALATASTRQIEDSYEQSLQALLKLAPEQLSSQRETRTSTDAAGKITSSSSSSSTAQAGDLAKVGGPTIPAGTLPGVLAGDRPTAGVNPMLSHLLATALLQEVKLLNNYVRSAPKLRDHVPFIVRMQVNVRQFGRNTPYDAQVDIAFGNGITAVPLLVSDSIDVSSASAARRNIRSLGLGLSALRGNFGLGLDVGSRTEQLLRALGSEFNSVLSVGQTPGKRHSISVHIGANDKDVDKHELLTRSHLVTVLLLVPYGRGTGECAAPARFACASFTPTLSFRHARTGEPLGETEQPATQFELEHWAVPRMPGSQLARVVLSGKKPLYSGTVLLRGGDGLVERMFDRVCLRSDKFAPPVVPVAEADSQKDRSSEGQRPMLCEGPDALLANSIDIVEQRNALQAKFDMLRLAGEAKPPVSAAAPSQAAVAKTVAAGRPADPRARHVAPLVSAARAAPDERAAPSGLDSSPGKQWLSAGGDPLQWVCFDVATDYGPPKPGPGGCVKILFELAAPSDPPPKLAATVTVSDARVIADREGRGSLSFAVSMPEPGEKTRPDRVELQVFGAGVRSVDVIGGNAGCARLVAALVVDGNCTVVLQLANAAPGALVTLKALALRRFAGEEVDTELAIAPSRDTLEVLAKAPELAVVVAVPQTVPRKP